MQNLAVLRAAVFRIHEKPEGVDNRPPPAVRGLRMLQASTGRCL